MKTSCPLPMLAIPWLALIACLVMPFEAYAGPNPDVVWQDIEQQRQALAADAPQGANEVEFYAPIKRKLHMMATVFVRNYPTHAHYWDAMLLELKTVEFPTPIPERRTVFDGQEKLLAEILAAPGASPEVKQTAERTVIFQHLDHLDLIDTPAQAAALEARLTDFIARHPTDPKANALQVRRLDLLEKSDPAKATALLDTLAASPDPKVASAARGRQQQKALTAAPVDWKFTAFDGTPVDMAALRGKFVLVDFWATWCPDCLRELPDVLAAYQKYHDRGLEIIGVSLDHDRDALAAFLKKRNIPWPQQFDGQGWDTAYAVKYGVRGIPEMWLVDRSGHVVAAGLHGSQLEARLAPLLPAAP